MAATGGLSDYEAARLQTVRENQAKLVELGLLDALPEPVPKRSKGNARAAHHKEPRDTTAGAIEPSAPAVPLRRSARLAGVPSVDYRERQLADGTSQHETRRRSLRLASSSALDSQADQSAFWTAKHDERSERNEGDAKPVFTATTVKSEDHARSRSEPASHGKSTSCRFLTARVDHMLHTYLGRHIPKLGGQVKRAVMNAACSSGTPTFNRMSGIQEWHNAVFLFINVSMDGYNNVFLNQQTEVTWFAQPTQKPTTRVIARLLAQGHHNPSGSPALVENLPPLEGVLLFCRLPDQPYVCLGRLQLKQSDTKTSPMRFLWTLQDGQALGQHSAAAEVLATSQASTKLEQGDKVVASPT